MSLAKLPNGPPNTSGPLQEWKWKSQNGNKRLIGVPTSNCDNKSSSLIEQTGRACHSYGHCLRPCWNHTKTTEWQSNHCSNFCLELQRCLSKGRRSSTSTQFSITPPCNPCNFTAASLIANHLERSIFTVAMRFSSMVPTEHLPYLLTAKELEIYIEHEKFGWPLEPTFSYTTTQLTAEQTLRAHACHARLWKN